MRTAAKHLWLRTVRRRFRVRVAGAASDWSRVVDDACALEDPQSIELAVSISVLMGVLLDRAVSLDDDCAGVPA